MVGKLQFIIDSRNNLNPKVLTLWKNVFKFNWRTIGACFILSLLFIPFAILNSHDNVHAGHVAQHVQSNHQILIDEIYNIAMFLICPLMYIAVTRIYLTNASAWKSTKYSFSLALRKHPQIWLVAVIYYALTSLLPTLLIISDIQIMVVFGSILSFIFISSYFILEPYYISYYLIQVYDDIANNPKLFIEK